jgi:hypothetical protein
MSLMTLTRSAAHLLATLHVAAHAHTDRVFSADAPAVRKAELPVETIQLAHPGLPGGRLTVDETDIVELCEHRWLTPLLDGRLAVTGFCLIDQVPPVP